MFHLIIVLLQLSIAVCSPELAIEGLSGRHLKLTCTLKILTDFLIGFKLNLDPFFTIRVSAKATFCVCWCVSMYVNGSQYNAWCFTYIRIVRHRIKHFLHYLSNANSFSSLMFVWHADICICWYWEDEKDHFSAGNMDTSCLWLCRTLLFLHPNFDDTFMFMALFIP